jgi:hypothetical protein
MFLLLLLLLTILNPGEYFHRPQVRVEERGCGTEATAGGKDKQKEFQ